MKKSTKEIIYWVLGLAVLYYLYSTYANSSSSTPATGQ